LYDVARCFDFERADSEEDGDFAVDRGRRGRLNEQSAGAEVLGLNLDGEAIDFAVQLGVAWGSDGTKRVPAAMGCMRLTRDSEGVGTGWTG
jgi:hypothetical protein